MPNSVTPRTVAHQAPLSTEFSKQEYWNGYPFLSPWDLLDPGIEPISLALHSDSLPSEPPGKPTLDLSSMYFNISGQMSACYNEPPNSIRVTITAIDPFAYISLT